MTQDENQKRLALALVKAGVSAEENHVRFSKMRDDTETLKMINNGYRGDDADALSRLTGGRGNDNYFVSSVFSRVVATAWLKTQKEVLKDGVITADEERKMQGILQPLRDATKLKIKMDDLPSEIHSLKELKKDYKDFCEDGKDPSGFFSDDYWSDKANQPTILALFDKQLAQKEQALVTAQQEAKNHPTLRHIRDGKQSDIVGGEAVLGKLNTALKSLAPVVNEQGKKGR